jgi:hypothetical protein
MKPSSPLALFATLLAAAPALALVGAGPTQVVSYEGYAVDGQVLLPRFEPELGQLEQVHLTLHLDVQGGLGFENTGPGRNFVTAEFGAFAQVLAPGGAQLVEALTVPIECNHVLAPFDGTIDLAGTSGVSFAGLAASAVTSRSLQADPVWVAGIVAAEGPIALTVETTGTTMIEGSGPLVVRRSQSASTVLVVEYEYTPYED